MKGTAEKALQEKMDKKKKFHLCQKNQKPTSENQRGHDDLSGKPCINICINIYICENNKYMQTTLLVIH